MRVLLLALLLSLTLPLQAQAQVFSDLTDACAKLISAPERADYRELRRFILVVMREKLGDVRKQAGQISSEAGQAYNTAREAGDLVQAERHLQRLLGVSCLFARSWYLAAAFYEKDMKDTAKAAWHRDVAVRLEKAAATFTDGKSRALPTIGIGEEYDFIRVLECQQPTRGSLHRNGRIHDLWRCNRPGIADDTILMAPYYDLDDLPP